MDSLTQLLSLGFGEVTLGRILWVVLLLFICLLSIRILLRALDKIFLHLKVPVTLLKMLRSVTKALLLFLTALIVLTCLGVPVTSLIAAMSVVGVAVSLSVQNFLSNVAGGFQLLGSHPFEVGDFVDAGGCSGTVTEIGLFYTKMTTPDNKLVQIPNSSVVLSNIVNYSSQSTRRVDLTVGVSYDAEPASVSRVLTDTLLAHPGVLREPPPSVRVSGYGPNAVQYAVRGWCDNDRYWEVYHDLLEAVRPALASHGISMVSEQVTVQVRQG